MTIDIDDMWYVLENEHKIGEIIKFEDDLKDKGKKMKRISIDNRTLEKSQKKRSKRDSQLSSYRSSDQFQDKSYGLGAEISKS